MPTTNTNYKLPVLNEYTGSSLGLYDSADPSVSITATKVVDASELCRDTERCVIKYASAIRGLIAQICDWYEKGRDLGATVHYFLDEMTPEKLARDEVFESCAENMGADPLELAEAIYANR